MIERGVCISGAETMTLYVSVWLTLIAIARRRNLFSRERKRVRWGKSSQISPSTVRVSRPPRASHGRSSIIFSNYRARATDKKTRSMDHFTSQVICIDTIVLNLLGHHEGNKRPKIRVRSISRAEARAQCPVSTFSSMADHTTLPRIRRCPCTGNYSTAHILRLLLHVRPRLPLGFRHYALPPVACLCQQRLQQRLKYLRTHVPWDPTTSSKTPTSEPSRSP